MKKLILLMAITWQVSAQAQWAPNVMGGNWYVQNFAGGPVPNGYMSFNNYFYRAMPGQICHYQLIEFNAVRVFRDAWGRPIRRVFPFLVHGNWPGLNCFVGYQTCVRFYRHHIRMFGYPPGGLMCAETFRQNAYFSTQPWFMPRW